MLLKLSKLDIAVGIGIAIVASLSVSIICTVLGQVLTHYYVR